MAELAHIIKEAAANPGAPLDAEKIGVLQHALSQYPYFSSAAAIVMTCSSDLPDDRELKELIGLQVSNPRILGFASAGTAWASFYPQMLGKAPKKTEDVIEIFLKNYGHSSPEEEKLLEKMIFNPTPDYGEILAREEQENLPSAPADPESQQGRIDSFILGHHPAAAAVESVHEPVREHKPISKPEPSNDSLLSESLAKVYIKQKRYESAYNIICSLNLKYPKKSAYFADQMRFLQKIIANARFLELQQKQQHTKKENQ